MIVTTSYEPTTDILQKAERAALEMGGRLVPRKADSMKQLRTKYRDSSILLVTKEEIRYYVEEQPPIFFHPSMGAIRVKRMLRGEKDLLLQAADVVEGDSVLDCTAGLASDAIVFAYGVGASGSVTALESEAIMALLIREGLAAYESDIPELNAAMRRIEVKHADHGAFLQDMDSQSVDVIYFDPMFREPLEESSSMNPLREVANLEAISLSALEEARRVARKCIVLKEHKDSPEFARLGFDKVLRSNTKITYGVIRL